MASELFAVYDVLTGDVVAGPGSLGEMQIEYMRLNQNKGMGYIVCSAEGESKAAEERDAPGLF